MLNPMFVYQLRAVNLSTGKPDSPPPGHWSAMAELMRGLISQQELDNLKLSYRLFKASLVRSCKVILSTYFVSLTSMTKTLGSVGVFV